MALLSASDTSAGGGVSASGGSAHGWALSDVCWNPRDLVRAAAPRARPARALGFSSGGRVATVSPCADAPRSARPSQAAFPASYAGEPAGGDAALVPRLAPSAPHGSPPAHAAEAAVRPSRGRATREQCCLAAGCASPDVLSGYYKRVKCAPHPRCRRTPTPCVC
jgi:hypothetical protein